MSKIDPHKLLISSDFYSVQGEGISSGIPSYFVRLGICNLTCGMSRAFTNNLMKEASLEDGEIFVGDLHAEGKATWTCDSTSQWLWRGVDQEFDYLLKRWKDESIYDDILKGNIHIIWTGGEPTIKGHQQAIVNFTNQWLSKHIDHTVSPFYEIETNGTVYIDEPLFKMIDQINCSPKLANSGMDKKQRFVEPALRRIMEHNNYQFKFVISTEDDVKEIFDEYITPLNIPLKNVVCMPGLDDQADFHERTNFVLEMAKIYKFRGLTRLHISAWNKTLNV
jgi:organic radical activating enzyme